MQHVREQAALTDPDEAPVAESGDLLVALRDASPFIALVTAIVAMSGSLYMSEVLGWIPCVLCWYQRILMYPLVLITLVGILRRDRGLAAYVLPLSIFGAGMSMYHYLLIKTNWLPPPPCAAGVSCTVDYLDWFGFINVPFLALTAFLIISLMMGVSLLRLEREDDAAA